MKIFSIKNEKISFFNRPIYAESEAEALSYIQNVLMSDADRALHSLKDDLALYYLGDIDFTTGVIDTIIEGPDSPADETVSYLIAPLKVCDLIDIFNTIPADRIPQTANELRKSIAELNSRLENLSKEVENNVDCSSCKRYSPKTL